MKKPKKSIHPDDTLHYEKMGLKRGEVELWEDGSRVDGRRGSYEWWYYDSHYPDGTVLVLFFFSKMPINVDGPIKPIASAELTLPDGMPKGLTMRFRQIAATIATICPYMEYSPISPNGAPTIQRVSQKTRNARNLRTSTKRSYPPTSMKYQRYKPARRFRNTLLFSPAYIVTICHATLKTHL